MNTKRHDIYLLLAAFNPKSKGYIRQKYKRKIAHFEEKCALIKYLSVTMGHGYHEPAERPIDFGHKVGKFLQLKQGTHVQ